MQELQEARQKDNEGTSNAQTKKKKRKKNKKKSKKDKVEEDHSTSQFTMKPLFEDIKIGNDETSVDHILTPKNKLITHNVITEAKQETDEIESISLD